MSIFNLTPHEIVIDCEDGFDPIRIPPSGQVARLEQSNQKVGTLTIANVNIPLYCQTFGKITGMPSPTGEDIYIVSRMVLDALSTEREDVYAPGEAIRDTQGRIIACKGLSR